MGEAFFALLTVGIARPALVFDCAQAALPRRSLWADEIESLDAGIGCALLN